MFDADTLLQIVLPKLLRMTLVSFVVGSVVGALVAASAALIRRSRLRRSGSLSQEDGVSRRSRLRASLWGSFLGTFLIGLLPIEANPASLIGGPYGAIWFGFMLLILVPAGATTGAVLGLMAAGAGRPRPNLSRLMAGSTVLAYLISTLVLALVLAPPTIGFNSAPATGPYPLVARLTGEDSPPLDLALNEAGDQLAVLSVRTSKQQLVILELSAQKRRGIRNLHGKPDGQRTLEDVLTSVAFSADGQELITAALQQVQVRTLPEGKTRLRLDGATVAYPMADHRLVTLAAVDALATSSKQPHSPRVWDLSTGQLLQTLPADLFTLEGRDLPIAVSADRRFLAFPRRPYDNQIHVWNIADNKLSSTLDLGKSVGILTLAFSPDGRQLAVALGQGPVLSIWDLASARQTRTLDAVDRVQKLYWTDQGLLVGSRGAFKVLNPRNGEVLHTLELQPVAPLPQTTLDLPLGPSALSGDGTTLAAYVPRQGIAVWRLGVHPPS
ncbi:MAG: WD40 repeat domain-containing protein [Cyanobium sp. CZS 48M]|nr:WD40 repeat domain-containing protein [Cyanobium sp. CZS48M]